MIWEFSDLVGRRLVLWAAVSVLAGLPLVAFGDPFWRGVGTQALVWGAIDGLIGLVGIRGAARDRRAGRGDPDAPLRAARKLRRLLLLNGGLDVLYVAGGLALATVVADGDPFTAGSGWGVVVQGGFLLVFDLLHARHVPAGASFLPPGFAPFAGPEHRAFELGSTPSPDRADTTRQAPPAALLLHGFPGTPAEMRRLGTALAADGWRVTAPLLPGMGEGIGDLVETRLDDWLAAVETAAIGLAGEPVERRAPFVVVGYSFGAALALVTARRLRPDALVLLAPFWWPRPWWSPLAAVVRPLFPAGTRPFARLDLEAPEVRAGVSSFLAGIDLDDPAVRASLRDVRIPISIFDRLFALSDRVGRAAAGLDLPVVVVQGTADEVVRPERTRRLVARFRRQPEIVEVAAGHELVGPRTQDPDAIDGPVRAFLATAVDGSLADRPDGDEGVAA